MSLTPIDFIAGWIGGVAGLVIGHPLDTIKVRQQIHHLSAAQTLVRIYTHEGFLGFYKGVVFPTIMMGPSNAVLFGVYGNFMRYTSGLEKGTQRYDVNDPTWLSRVFIGGCIAGVFQVIATCPVELIKTILQAQTQHSNKWESHSETKYTGILDSIRGVYVKSGVTGLYRGFVPMLIRDVPTSGLYYLTYEYMMEYKYPVDFLNARLSKEIIAGGLAGVNSWIPVIPFDFVKSMIQIDDPRFPKYKGMRDCFAQSYRSGGIFIFTKGCFAVAVRAFISNAAAFVAFENVFRLYKDTPEVPVP